MATYRVIAWKGIAASVEAQDGADSATVELSERFQMLIDSVAMQRGLHGSDEYLDSWTRGEPQDRPGTARQVADAVAADLESRFAEFAARAFTIA
jgi:Virulence factor